MDEIRAAIVAVLGEIQPATVRQVYYQLVGRGVIAKTEAEYKSTVVRLLTGMRRERFHTGPRGAREWRYRRTDQSDQGEST
jgi:hypothetical protein